MDGIVGGEGFVNPFPPEEVGEPDPVENEESLPPTRDQEKPKKRIRIRGSSSFISILKRLSGVQGG